MGAKKARRKQVRKEAHINIRLTEEQKDELTVAATHAGLGVSSWLLVTGLQEARKNAKETDGGDK
jgi:uncharacterized protein (DUF1778 family)